MLAPLLACHVMVRRGPRLVAAGLLLSAAGDVALMFPDTAAFVIGMGCFASAHVCYVTFFVRRGVAQRLRRQWPIPLGYAALWGTLVLLLWTDLKSLRVPVAIYSMLLTATAIASLGFGLRTGAGGALFFLSDTLIAFRLAGTGLPLSDVGIMGTYIAAQFLIASGSSATASTARPGARLRAAAPGRSRPGGAR
ncbi:lysoplasmalogenase [Microbispora triticiradicis]|nr:lysoplasmalogenase [Microbispora triticiradicis]